jgi:hypothetical protein
MRLADHVTAAFRAVADRIAAAAAWVDARVDPEPNWRAIWVPLALGIVLVLVSYRSYDGVATPPRPPSVEGAGEVYVGDPSVAVDMRVAVDPGADHRPGRWPIVITLVLVGDPGTSAQAREVDWALLLRGDAMLVDDSLGLPPGSRVQRSSAGQPPFALAEPQPVQVVSGRTALTNLGNSRGAVQILGDLPIEVSSRSGPRLALVLPRYGEVAVNPAFDLSAGPFDLGLAGDWHRPTTFRVTVDAGARSPDQRVDSTSPEIADPARLQWVDDVGVRPTLLLTSIAGEANTQRATFGLGAVVGAGAASILTALERIVVGLRRAARRSSGPAGPGPPREAVPPGSGSSPGPPPGP